MEVPLDEETAGKAAPPSGAGGSLGSYYDRLERGTAWLRTVGYGGGRHALTVHRALADPAAGGRPTVTRLHDVLLAALPAEPAGHVLDAGCGYGGTMLDFAARTAARFTGVTLSERQAAIGRAAVERAGLGNRIAIEVADYDEPPPGPFDLIVAIESLAHSPRPLASVEALAKRLARGGALAIVDDMPLPAARGAAELAVFQMGWRAPVLADDAAYRTTLTALGLEIVVDRDLTAELRPRSATRIARLERLNLILRRCIPVAGFRNLLDSYRGGLALEALYRRGLMAYRLIVARRD